MAPTLAFFDMERPTRLCTDASRQGIGFILQQQTAADHWALVQAGSRFLSSAESRYAIIELELLAVAWAVAKCKMFLTGLQHFKVITDHNPLISILNSHRLDEIENPRLQRLRAKLMAYNFTAVWCKGTTNKAPDALSRNPVWEPHPTDALAEYDENNAPEPTAAEIRAVCDNTSQESARLHQLREYAMQDEAYQQLKKVILQGFPDHKSQLPDSCRRYWQVRHHLTVEEDLIVHGCRLVIPAEMRKSILEQLHMSHQGIVRTKQRARNTLYWPGMDNDIENLIAACSQCQDYLQSNSKEPLQLKPKPARPFQEVAVDFCYHAGRHYLVWVDCYSDWPIIAPMGRDITTKHLLATLVEIFSQTAVPDIMWTDRGPQFTARSFQSFAQQWGFKHCTSTPHYPQSNGKAEAAVKSMKKLIRAAWNGRYLEEETLCRALLQYRNTPSRKDGMSPAQKLYGHPIQDSLPTHPRAFAPEWQHSTEQTEQATQASEKAASEYYNATAHSLPDIKVGSHVAVQNPRTKLWDTYGVVKFIGPHRQYHIQTRKGTVLLRNRRYIRRRVPASIPVGQSVTRQPTLPRRSSRPRKPAKRLIEDPSWT